MLGVFLCSCSFTKNVIQKETMVHCSDRIRNPKPPGFLFPEKRLENELKITLEIASMERNMHRDMKSRCIAWKNVCNNLRFTSVKF